MPIRNSELRHIYAQKALSQIPRLLSNMDRNPYSPTYGCFHRDYWLDKTSDFPDAVRQFGVQALALIYKYKFPDNIYQNNNKIRDWAIAALDFWSKIQHQDGSFDEFYPYERGWVGPTAFTTYASIEAFQLLKKEIPDKTKSRITNTIKKAAYFIAEGETEEDHLANHHAMASLALWKAYKLLHDDKLKTAFDKAFSTFITYHDNGEGWSREYDGIDPGYLSATVSFLSKIYQDHPDPRIKKIIESSIKMSSYFVYPNGFYAGSLGSRNTLHFYPHGFEIMSHDFLIAASVSEKMLFALGQNKLVPPEIISDRYVFYRVPEYLQAYLDYSDLSSPLPELPYEKKSLNKYFKKAKILALSKDNHYLIANLAKGGVFKIFNQQSQKLIYNDCGIIGRLDNNMIITSQWIDDNYQIEVNNNKISISGNLQYIPPNKLFTLLKNIIFRIVLLLTGWSPKMSHFIKGKIRKSIILGQRPAPVSFTRKIYFGTSWNLTDEITINSNVKIKKLSIGDEFFVRYVPQSRYFQSQELDIHGWVANKEWLSQLNNNKTNFRKTKLL